MAQFLDKQGLTTYSNLIKGELDALDARIEALENGGKYMPVTGGTFTGAVSGIDPTANANLTTKAYVDNIDSNINIALTALHSEITDIKNTTDDAMPRSGGVFTGDVAMASNARLSGILTPESDGDAVNKAYVDNLGAPVATTWNLTKGNNNTNFFGLRKSSTEAGSMSSIILRVSENASVTGLYLGQNNFWYPTYLYAKSSNLQVTTQNTGCSITYLFDGQIKTKKITKENRVEPIETMEFNQVLAVLAVH